MPLHYDDLHYCMLAENVDWRGCDYNGHGQKPHDVLKLLVGKSEEFVQDQFP